MLSYFPEGPLDIVREMAELMQGACDEDVMLKVSQENKERLDKIKCDTEKAQKIKTERIRVEYESGWSTSKMK